MILLRNLRLSIEKSEAELPVLAAKALKIPADGVTDYKIVKKSLDARKKSDIHWLYSLALEVKDSEKAVLSRCGNKNASVYEPFRYSIPSAESADRPVVVGFGPCGIFAALVLAEAGLRPIVLERGDRVETRRAKVEEFWRTGTLDTESNVQFGEGGAGTFSDGKLNTGTHDIRARFVLEQFCRFGAPENVCYDAKPHVGTDVLGSVVKNMRNHICSLGGEVRFRSKMTSLGLDNGRVVSLGVAGPDGEYTLPCSRVILAPGHSARDTFEMLSRMGLALEPKPFSMGVRIEHKQQRVGESQYGEKHPLLPPADYKLNCRLPNGESAYTFCMCPGGLVVASSSEAGGVVTNGMSYSSRGGENANSALLVSLSPEDFPYEGPLGGMYWQRDIERACFEAGGSDYRAPAQTVGDFLARRPSECGGSVVPSYLPGVKWCDLRRVLPQKITDTMAEAIPLLARRLSCFDDAEAVLTAPESRSSSPVRILRGADCCAAGISGLYPSGEGAGYAGGITSAAVDGVRCAEAVIASVLQMQA